ncbi:hypothetical protein BC939DRAFT_513331, partial [Gamsiella multidivaricata]|uniref:uncharacterized protein n=1 Tax=Gamsiella multidivaricata TaxID=101098 RepID=UPI00221FFC4E
MNLQSHDVWCMTVEWEGEYPPEGLTGRYVSGIAEFFDFIHLFWSIVIIKSNSHVGSIRALGYIFVEIPHGRHGCADLYINASVVFGTKPFVIRHYPSIVDCAPKLVIRWALSSTIMRLALLILSRFVRERVGIALVARRRSLLERAPRSLPQAAGLARAMDHRCYHSSMEQWLGDGIRQSSRDNAVVVIRGLGLVLVFQDQQYMCVWQTTLLELDHCGVGGLLTGSITSTISSIYNGSYHANRTSARLCLG